MPTYDYRCDACGHELEFFQSMSEAPKRKCPECGALKLRRLIGTGGGLIFKGSGFYLTDYRSDSYKQGAEAEKKSSETASDSSKGAETPASKKGPEKGAEKSAEKGPGKSPGKKESKGKKAS